MSSRLAPAPSSAQCCSAVRLRLSSGLAYRRLSGASAHSNGPSSVQAPFGQAGRVRSDSALAKNGHSGFPAPLDGGFESRAR
jgi:hypothetical protein